MRRHSHRKHGGGSQLSQAGVELARRVGEESGPFATVVATVSPRTRETAVAMGFAVDHELVTLADTEPVYAAAEASQWWRADRPFSALARLVDGSDAYRRYAHGLAAAWRDLLTPLSADDSALIIGHSGDIESALVACAPDADHAAWGGPLGPLEGARLRFTGALARFTDIEIIRVAEA